MQVVEDKAGLRTLLKAQAGKTVGFVPTMGFLHDGHLSLMRKAREECDYVVASIFVNPTQFGPTEDLDAYPTDREGDLAKCEDAGVDLVWTPHRDSVYASDHVTTVHVSALTEVLCGASRPGHFDGVTTIVTKLFNLVRPDRAYFGQKDYQQLAVIRRMVRDLDMPITIVGLPTIREDDGLAMSSRNTYLDADARQRALALSRGLIRARRAWAAGSRNAEALSEIITGTLDDTPGVVIDYVRLVDPESLEVLSGQISDRGAVAAIAARVGPARLIDNARLDLEHSNNLPPQPQR